jgi:hypothetical protein
MYSQRRAIIVIAKAGENRAIKKWFSNSFALFLGGECDAVSPRFLSLFACVNERGGVRRKRAKDDAATPE